MICSGEYKKALRLMCGGRRRAHINIINILKGKTLDFLYNKMSAGFRNIRRPEPIKRTGLFGNYRYLSFTAKLTF